MKLTKEQLRQIIKEEVMKAISAELQGSMTITEGKKEKPQIRGIDELIDYIDTTRQSYLDQPVERAYFLKQYLEKFYHNLYPADKQDIKRFVWTPKEEDPDAEWMDAEASARQEDWPPEEDSEDEWPEASWEQDQSWRDEARDIEGRPQEEDPEALKLPNPWDEPGGPKAFTKRVGARFRGEPPPIKRRPKQKMNPDTPPEERKRGHVYWDEEEGRNKVHLERKGRIKELELKDMIRTILEEESELLENQ